MRFQTKQGSDCKKAPFKPFQRSNEQQAPVGVIEACNSSIDSDDISQVTLFSGLIVPTEEATDLATTETSTSRRGKMARSRITQCAHLAIWGLLLVMANGLWRQYQQLISAGILSPNEILSNTRQRLLNPGAHDGGTRSKGDYVYQKPASLMRKNKSIHAKATQEYQDLESSFRDPGDEDQAHLSPDFSTIVLSLARGMK